MIPLFDGHCDTLLYMRNTGEGLDRNGGQLDLDRAACYGPYAQFFAVFHDRAVEGPPMWERFLAQAELFERTMARHADRIVHCRSGRDAQLAARQGKTAAFLSVEGGELLDCDEEKLEQAWRMGVRAVNITWNHANALSGSHKDRPEQGLTPQGVRFVRRMRALGMLIDVSHLSDPGVRDVLEYAPGPVIATHSNARSVFFHTRNLTDGQITAIIKSRGVIGLNLYAPFVGADPTPDDLVAHLEHMLALGGEDTVALGGDWDGAETLVRGFRDIADWRVLYEALLRRNYPEALVQNLFYFNMMRIVNEVCNT